MFITHTTATLHVQKKKLLEKKICSASFKTLNLFTIYAEVYFLLFSWCEKNEIIISKGAENNEYSWCGPFSSIHLEN